MALIVVEVNASIGRATTTRLLPVFVPQAAALPSDLECRPWTVTR